MIMTNWIQDQNTTAWRVYLSLIQSLLINSELVRGSTNHEESRVHLKCPEAVT